MSEETIIDQTVSNEKPQSKAVRTPETNGTKRTNIQTPKPEKKDMGSKKTIGVASMAGAAGVIAGLLTPVQLFPQSSDIEDDNVNAEGGTTPDISSNNGHYDGHEMDVATTVDDSMSFSEAFAAARNEVGPGGLFTWHGHTYGTYYADEWNAMSEADKDQYWADVYHTTSHLNEDLQNDDEIEISDVEINDVDIVPDDSVEDEELEDIDEIAEIDDISDDAIELDENPDEMLGELADDNSEEFFADDAIDGSDDSLDFAEDGTDLDNMDENPDLDMLASNSSDPDIPIDNNMDMSDFA